MPTLQDLPLELHLFILQSSSLDAYDLVHYRAVSPLWRAIIDINRNIQERLFLRPLAPPILPAAIIGIAIIAVIRPVPITTEFEFNDGLYEMSLKAYTWADPHVRDRVHPMLNDFAKWLHLLNHNFVRVPSAWAIAPALPSMRFCGMKQLWNKATSHHNTDSPALWRAMYISLNQYDQFNLYWALDMRSCAKVWERVGRGVHLNTATGAKLRDLETQYRLVLRRMAELLDEYEDGKVVSRRNFWLDNGLRGL